MTLQKTLTHTALLTAADCNAQFEMPMAMLGQTIVEVATAHATHLGVDYKRLREDGNAWVLMRLTVEMSRMPRAGEHYRLTTWVSSFNRHFSERDFEISAGTNPDNMEVIGYARTIWTAINSTTRQAASLDGLIELEKVVTDRTVELRGSPRIKAADFAAEGVTSMEYRVAVSDIDTNRHLTAMRYVELMLNMMPLDFYDANRVARFEIAYSNEARWDEQLRVSRIDNAPSSTAFLLTRGTETLSIGTLEYSPR